MIEKELLLKIEANQQKIGSFRPLSDSASKQLRNYYRVGLTYSSNALEGNTLTETETKVVLEDGLTIGGKTLREHEEAIGHARAYDFLYELSTGPSDISEEDIKKIHRLFYGHIDEENAGDYRKVSVIITGTDFIPPKPNKLPELMNEFVESQKQLRRDLHPVHYAAELHREFVYILPFVDGNGRVARILMNIALLQYAYPITIIPPVLRSEYILSLRQSDTCANDSFENFIARRVYESQKEFMRLVETLQD